MLGPFHGKNVVGKANPGCIPYELRHIGAIPASDFRQKIFETANFRKFDLAFINSGVTRQWAAKRDVYFHLFPVLRQLVELPQNRRRQRCENPIELNLYIRNAANKSRAGVFIKFPDLSEKAKKKTPSCSTGSAEIISDLFGKKIRK